MKEWIRINKRIVFIILGLASALTAVAVFLIINLSIFRQQKYGKSAGFSRDNSSVKIPSVKDFYLDTRDSTYGFIYPSRERRRKWDESDVEKYWIDPSEAGLDKLSEENDRLILERLQKSSGEGIP